VCCFFTPAKWQVQTPLPIFFAFADSLLWDGCEKVTKRFFLGGIANHPHPFSFLPEEKLQQRGYENPTPCENFGVFHYNDWDSGIKK
jgi:hypothetical protein